MTAQDKKFLLDMVNKIGTILNSRLKIRSVIKNGFTFVPDAVSVPDAFCIINKSDLAYNTMKLCQAKTGQYWIEITFSEIPERKTQYWNGKKFKDYN